MGEQKHPFEHRRDPRVTLSLLITFRLSGTTESTWCSGMATDISAGGLRMRTEEQLQVGEQLEFKLLVPVRPEPYLLFGQIVWKREPAPARVEYGVAFVDVTPDKQAEIDALVEFLRKRPGQPS